MNPNTDLGSISIGNAENYPATRGWFVGGFLDNTAGVRLTDHVEIKWSTHPEGDHRPEIAPGGDTTTVTILVSGRFEVVFPGEDPGRVLLADQGDYAAFGPGIAHTWRALEPSVMVTVRWRATAGVSQ
jgi:hypothetical protein